MDKEIVRDRLSKLSEELDSIIEELSDTVPVYEERYFSEDRITWINMPTPKSRYTLIIEKDKHKRIASNEVRVEPIVPLMTVPPYTVFITQAFKEIESVAKTIAQKKQNNSNSHVSVEFTYNLRIEEWKTKPS